MKLTVGMLKQIIKEEVAKAAGTRPSSARKGLVREFGMPMKMGRSGHEEESPFMEIPNDSTYAKDSGESLNAFVGFVEGLARQHGNTPEGPEGGPAYSRRHDSMHIMGSQASLSAFARALDMELMGGAQSISDEDSFEGLIQPL